MCQQFDIFQKKLYVIRSMRCMLSCFCLLFPGPLCPRWWKCFPDCFNTFTQILELLSFRAKKLMVFKRKITGWDFKKLIWVAFQLFAQQNEIKLEVVLNGEQVFVGVIKCDIVCVEIQFHQLESKEWNIWGPFVWPCGMSDSTFFGKEKLYWWRS